MRPPRSTTAGRVLAVGAQEVLLQLPGGDLAEVAYTHEAPRLGDLVRARPGGGAVEIVHRHPTGDYPRPHTDGSRFTAPGRWQRLGHRAELLHRTRLLFRARGLLEVETPRVVDAPGTEVQLAPTPVVQRTEPGAAPRRRYLITSPEYHMKRLLAGGAPAIFQLCRVWRDAEHGDRHRAEFTMLEWYRPWAGLAEIMSDCEAWIRALNGGDRLAYRGASVDLTPPWPRVKWFDALTERAGIVEPRRLTPDEQLRALVEHVEPTLGRGHPEFLVDYPIEMASLARPSPADPTVAERFELYVEALELANAFGELTDAAEQRRRCEADNSERARMGLPELPLGERFLGALAEGMPPSAGSAAGFDRVVMLLTDAPDIDDVLAF